MERNENDEEVRTGREGRHKIIVVGMVRVERDGRYME